MNTRIVILCAGKGKRMGASVPKPLVEVAGKPMIVRLLESIKDSGVDARPILVVSPEGEQYFKPLCEREGCEYAVQTEQLGTGHAVRAAQAAARDAQTVIVLYGDHPFISQRVVNQLVELRMTQGAPLVMLTTQVPHFENDYAQFLNWGRVLRGENGSVQGLREYKDASEEERAILEVNPGIYSFEANWLWEHLAKLGNENASQEYYLTDLVKMAIDEGSGVVTGLVENPFEVMGINSPEELERAEKIVSN